MAMATRGYMSALNTIAPMAPAPKIMAQTTKPPTTPMPTTPQAAGLAPPTNWGQYIGDGTEIGGARSGGWDPTESDQALKYIQQYDPTASIQGTMMPGGEGGQYIKFDNSKLPTNSRGQHGILGLSNLSGLKNEGDYMGPRGVDKVWGNVGAAESRQWKDPRSMVDTWGPIIMAAITGGAGLAAGGMPLGASLGQGAVNLARSVGSGNGFSALSILPMLSKIPGLFAAGPGG